MTDLGDKAATVCERLPIVALMVWGELANPREMTLAIGNDKLCFTLRGASLKSSLLASLLASPTVKVTYDAKTAQRLLYYFGITLDYVIDVGANSALFEFASASRNTNESENENLPAWSAVTNGFVRKYPLESGRRYEAPPFRPPKEETAADEVSLCYQVLLAQISKLKALDMGEVSRIEGNAAPALGEMEAVGIYVDVLRLEGLIEELKAAQSSYEQKLSVYFSKVGERDLFGKLDISYENDAQVQAAARKMGLYIQKFSREALLNLNHPIGELLWNFRDSGRQKALLTNLKGLLDEKKRVRPHFHSFGAATGRMSVNNPNVQSIPKDERHRRLFCAPEGGAVITADYSTFEMRILAQFSGDPRLIEALQQGKDFHSAVASEVFNTEVSREENVLLRSRAKTISFGLCYGMGAQGLARQLGISREEAGTLLNKYFAALPGVKNYLEEAARTALETGICKTLSGRRLALDIERAETDAERGQLERVAKNMPIQGTNADILKIALVRLRRAFMSELKEARVVNCIHDEIVVEAPEEEAKKAAAVLREQMIKAAESFIDKVPIEIEVKIGTYWGDEK